MEKTFKAARIRFAIIEILWRNEYPSAAKINDEMGRNTRTLNGPECRIRRRLFREFKIKMKGKKNNAIQK